MIALSEAGFKATVAPLGTAITEDQLQLLWRIHDEPIIALDGDDAGIRAALRLIDLALPHFDSRKTLKFWILPLGEDPDDFVKKRRAEAVETRLGDATSAIDFLWARMSFGDRVPSIQEEAKLGAQIKTVTDRIQDSAAKRAISDSLQGLLRQNRWKWQRKRDEKRRLGSSRSAKMSELAETNAAFDEHLKEAVILATLVKHPDIVPEFISDLERLETGIPEHDAVRRALLETEGAEQDKLEAICGAAALEKLFSPRHVRISPGVRSQAARDIATMTVAEELAKLAARRGARAEIEEAARDIEGLVDEGLTWRLRQASEGVVETARGSREDKAEYDLGPNGARLRRDERSDFEALIDRIDYTKGGRRG